MALPNILIDTVHHAAVTSTICATCTTSRLGDASMWLAHLQVSIKFQKACKGGERSARGERAASKCDGSCADADGLPCCRLTCESDPMMIIRSFACGEPCHFRGNLRLDQSVAITNNSVYWWGFYASSGAGTDRTSPEESRSPSPLGGPRPHPTPRRPVPKLNLSELNQAPEAA